jgi:hypothetical protein
MNLPALFTFVVPCRPFFTLARHFPWFMHRSIPQLHTDLQNILTHQISVILHPHPSASIETVAQSVSLQIRNLW